MINLVNWKMIIGILMLGGCLICLASFKLSNAKHETDVYSKIESSDDVVAFKGWCEKNKGFVEMDEVVKDKVWGFSPSPEDCLLP